ncbi:MAG: LytR/AlgR family response regulator transcription factor, partial [Flavobacteriales bacterium]
DKAGFKQSLLTIAYVGVFVALFLFFIRPFGIEGSWADLAVASVGFGAVTIAFGWVFEAVSRYALKIQTHGPKWTLGKWMIMSIVLVVWIAFGNYLFVNFLSGWNAVGYFNFIRMIGYTSLIGIFPVALSGLVVQMRAEKANEIDAQSLDSRLQEPPSTNSKQIRLTDSAGKELKLNSEQIRYAEAMQNYVTVWFVEGNEMKKETLRATVSSIEEQLSDCSVIRCHRSYLVNVNTVEKVSGNAQGLRLKLSAVSEFEVPVSRSYIDEIRRFMD